MALRNVLVLPGGTEIGLEIGRALRRCKEVRLVSAGLSGTPASHCFDRHLSIPKVSDPTFLDRLVEIVAQESITHIIPAHDDVIAPLAAARPLLKESKVVTSDLDTCLIARSKKRTVAHLCGVIPTPVAFEDVACIPEFPVFVKPEAGQGSRGAAIASTPRDLEVLLSKDPSLIIQEYLPGEEFTVDCFSDRDTGVLYSAVRQRLRVTSGIASRSCIISDAEFVDYAVAINQHLPFWGAWFFQMRRSKDGVPTLLEVAPRIAGTSCLSRASGVNLPLLSLYESDRIAVHVPPPIEGVVLERTLAPMYTFASEYEALYIDFDDTLVIHGRVNTTLVRLIYQAIHLGRPVILVTRHAGDITSALKKHRLQGLFDEVVHLTHGENKADFVKHTTAVFIDDSFRELELLRKRSGITALHVSSAEMLLNDRID